MSGNPRENVKDKGFWDGGAAGHGTNKESAGRANGYPGKRTPDLSADRTQRPGDSTRPRHPGTAVGRQDMPGMSR